MTKVALDHQYEVINYFSGIAHVILRCLLYCVHIISLIQFLLPSLVSFSHLVVTFEYT